MGQRGEAALSVHGDEGRGSALHAGVQSPAAWVLGDGGGGQHCVQGCMEEPAAWGAILLAWIPLTLAKIWPQMLEIATILSALSMRSLSTSPRSIVRGPNEQKRQGVNQIPATEHQHC